MHGDTLFKAVFKGLLNTAYAATRFKISLTTEDQVAAEEEIALRFNLGAALRGWDIRLEVIGPSRRDPDPPVFKRWRKLVN